MKKWAALVLALACALGLASCWAAGKKPYKNLTAAELSSAAVHLAPPDRTIQIEDVDEVAELLRDVVIYGKDNSYTEYAGQGVTFTLTMTDGSQTSIMAYNPFLVIDGVGYKTEYKPCEALNRYANRLLSSENAAVVLEEPPALSVISEEASVAAWLGSYSWEIRGGDGTAEATIADSAHPLECRETLPVLETAEETAVLRFQEAPDPIVNVRCWSDAHWSDPDADSETVEVEGDTIGLKPGGYIYEITAQWNTENGSGGTACYSIYIKAI